MTDIYNVPIFFYIVSIVVSIVYTIYVVVFYIEFVGFTKGVQRVFRYSGNSMGRSLDWLNHSIGLIFVPHPPCFSESG